MPLADWMLHLIVDSAAAVGCVWEKFTYVKVAWLIRKSEMILIKSQKKNEAV